MPGELTPSGQAETRSEAEQPGSQPESQPPRDHRAVLGRDGWIRAAPAQQEHAARLAYRWRYPSLEDLLARPPGQRPNLRACRHDADPIVAANAAIGLARLGDAAGAGQLALAVRTPELKLPIRLAAAESLAALRKPSPVEPLRELIDQYSHARSDEHAYPIPELHAELIRGLARHVDPADDRRFLDALRSRSAGVRLEAVRAWTDGRGGRLPLELADLRTDPDSRVRSATLRCLAQRRHPRALQHLAAALEDHDLRVRLAAIAAFGDLGGPEAQAALERLLKDRAEVIRAAAVSALAAAGAEQTVLDAAADQSWRVRVEVARALARYPDRDGVAVAGQLLDDASSMVQREVVASLGHWPLRLAAPVLLAAMGKAGYKTRKTAAEQLAALWPPAAQFPVDAPEDRRAEVLLRLERLFRREIGFVDPEVLTAAAIGLPVPSVSPEQVAAVERLVEGLSDPSLPAWIRRRFLEAMKGFGPALIDALEPLALDRHRMLPEMVYREVLPNCAEEFAALERLGSPDVSIRRRAAEELVALTKAQPLRRLAAARLAMVTAAETDPLVWQHVLTAVAADPSEAAVRLACAALAHPLPEVRRRACEHLAAHPMRGGQHVKSLLSALEDENVLVVRAAARALGLSGRLDDMEPLRRLLASPHEPLCVEAAVALARLGDPSGPAALERLSYSADQTVRRRVAAAMGEIGDPAFTSSLVRLLDDHYSIRLVALESLPKVVGRDVTEAADPSASSGGDRALVWRQWFEQHEQALPAR